VSQLLKPIDAHGTVVALGAHVRISRLPGWLVHDLPGEDVARLQAVKGSVMQVLEIDKFGYLWFGVNNRGRWFCLRPGEIEVVIET
jgi:hypothetical protein